MASPDRPPLTQTGSGGGGRTGWHPFAAGEHVALLHPDNGRANERRKLAEERIALLHPCACDAGVTRAAASP